VNIVAGAYPTISRRQGGLDDIEGASGGDK